MKNKLQKLLESKKKLVGDMRAMSDKAESENRGLTPEEETRYGALESEYDSLDTTIAREKRLSEREEEEQREDDNFANEPAYGGASEDGGESRSEEEDEERSGRDRRSVARGAGNGQKGASRWAGGFGEFLQAVAAAEDRNHRVDPRLVKVRAATGMNEVVPSEGGFLVEKDMIGGLMQRVFEVAKLASRCKRLPVGPGKNGITMLRLKDDSRATGSRYGGIRTYWLGEAETKRASKPEFDVMEMKLKKLAALCYATDELLEDAVALEGLISDIFPQEMAFTIDDAILYGTGVGQPLGLLNSNAVVTVAAEAGQTADTVVYENVLNMLARFWETGGSNPVWYINRNVLPSLSKMSLTIGTGGVPVWMPANGAAGQQGSTLFGYPVVMIEHASSIGDVGDIWLADMSQYLLIEKGGVKKDVSIHVRFINDETCFRFVKRVDGQPIPTAAITPYKGTGTLSPFVTLAAR